MTAPYAQPTQQLPRKGNAYRGRGSAIDYLGGSPAGTSPGSDPDPFTPIGEQPPKPVMTDPDPFTVKPVDGLGPHTPDPFTVGMGPNLNSGKGQGTGNVPVGAMRSSAPSAWNPSTGGGYNPPRPGAGGGYNPGGTFADGTPTYAASGAPRGTSQFGPGNNLIGTQFTPAPSQRLQNTQAATDSAFQKAQNYQFQGFNPQAPLDTSGAKGSLATGNQQMQSQSVAGYQPVAGTDLSRARSALDMADANYDGGAGQYAGMGQTGGFAYGADTTGVRGQTKAQLDKVLNTNPDRLTLASNAFQRLLDESAPAHEQELRRVGQKAAALGRVGAGMTTNDLGTVQQRREEALLRERGRLADEAAGLSLQDEDAKLNAARGVTSDFSSQDLGAGQLNLGYQNSNNAERGAAFDRTRALGQDRFGNNLALSEAETRQAQIRRGDDLEERDARTLVEDRQNAVARSRGEASRQYGLDTYGIDADSYDRGTRERDSALDYDQRMFDNRARLYGMGADEEQRLTGNERADRNEWRGERDYQYGLDRDAVGDSRYDQEYQDRRYDTRFGQGLDLLDAGSRGNPADRYDRYSEQFGEDADSSYGALGDLFGQYALGRRRAPGQGRPRASDPLDDLSMS